MTLRASVAAAITANYGGTGLAPAIANLAAFDPIGFTSGVGNYQSDLLYAATRTLTTGAADNLDLAGSLVDPLGAVLNTLNTRLDAALQHLGGQWGAQLRLF